jgi:hypothetical protein
MQNSCGDGTVSFQSVPIPFPVQRTIDSVLLPVLSISIVIGLWLRGTVFVPAQGGEKATRV